MKSKICLIILITAMALDARALVGDERGNGGSVIACRHLLPPLLSVEVFDVWEQRQSHGFLYRGSRSTKPLEIAIEILDRVRDFSPHRGEAYGSFVRGFLDQVQWVGPLAKIPDLDTDLGEPENCRFEQLIVRRKQIVFPEDRRYLVDKNLWDHLNPLMKAAAILHEAFYDEALVHGHTSSRLVRYFHVKMNLNESYKMTDRDYVETVSVSRFPFWEFRRAFQRELVGRKTIDFVPEQLRFDEQGSLRSISAVPGVPLELYHELLWEPWQGSFTGFYTEFVKSIEFTVSDKGITSTAVLRKSQGGARPWVMIREQRIPLAEEGRIVIYPDNSLQVSLDGCFQEPKSGAKLCGNVRLDPDRYR